MFTLDQIVPWGRSFDEYRRVFAMSDDDLSGRILGCADGPASFNAEATRRGARVVSCDPVYRCETAQIRDRIAVTCDRVLEQTRQNLHEFVWDTIRSVEELGRVRMEAMQAFLDDFEVGRLQGRYVDAELPALPFHQGSFEAGATGVGAGAESSCCLLRPATRRLPPTAQLASRPDTPAA